MICHLPAWRMVTVPWHTPLPSPGQLTWRGGWFCRPQASHFSQNHTTGFLAQEPRNPQNYM